MIKWIVISIPILVTAAALSIVWSLVRAYRTVDVEQDDKRYVLKSKRWLRQRNGGLSPRNYSAALSVAAYEGNMILPEKESGIKENMEDFHWGIVEKAVEAIREQVAVYQREYAEVRFHEEQVKSFERLFRLRYADIKSRFMTEDTTELDSHKQAALLTICCLEAGLVTHPVEESEIFSIVPYLAAVNTGLEYMRSCLNALLREKGIDKQMNEYILPVAVACDTPYEEIICRLLYYENTEKDMKFNVLELSDRYFLIEYANLLQLGIEPLELR